MCAFQPLAGFLKQEGKRVWQESDRRYFIEQFLRSQLHTSELYCEEARAGVVVVRAPGAADRQMVYLLQYDLDQALQGAAAWPLKRLVVVAN